MRNLKKSQYYKYIAILSIGLRLSIKIIIFGIANMSIIENIKNSNFSNPSFFIFIIIYVIFKQSSNSLYNCISSQIYKKLQIYSNTLNITITNNAKVSILENIFFKCFIKLYFFESLSNSKSNIFYQ